MGILEQVAALFGSVEIGIAPTAAHFYFITLLLNRRINLLFIFGGRKRCSIFLYLTILAHTQRRKKQIRLF